ncbi:hypothetical protein B0H21DRAFT_840685 [Amylocystis lapponica]|nr:hypothetical protein B0H21DRAFT_840685 [Amylocystis lapponica]
MYFARLHGSQPPASHGRYKHTAATLVTGAAQGLGAAIALRLADDGLDVAVNDLRAKRAALDALVARIRAKGRRALALAADAQVRAMVAAAAERLGGLDVMVANAGVAVPGRVVDMDVAQWDAVMAANVRGAMLCYKYAAAQMIRQGRGGRVIGASSISGKRALQNASAYSASTFAIRGLTQAASQELAPHGITVNSYAPGFILTEMGASARPPRTRTHSPQLVGYPPDTPDAAPDVVASIVSYLAKPEAYFVTGQCVAVDGGVTFD